MLLFPTVTAHSGLENKILCVVLTQDRCLHQISSCYPVRWHPWLVACRALGCHPTFDGCSFHTFRTTRKQTCTTVLYTFIHNPGGSHSQGSHKVQNPARVSILSGRQLYSQRKLASQVKAGVYQVEQKTRLDSDPRIRLYFRNIWIPQGKYMNQAFCFLQSFEKKAEGQK